MFFTGVSNKCREVTLYDAFTEFQTSLFKVTFNADTMSRATFRLVNQEPYNYVCRYSMSQHTGNYNKITIFLQQSKRDLLRQRLPCLLSLIKSTANTDDKASLLATKLKYSHFKICSRVFDDYKIKIHFKNQLDYTRIL